jgi:membrane fusion protein, adhesin transport system
MNAVALPDRSVSLDANLDLDRGARRAVKILLAVLAALLAFLVGWAVLASLDVSVQAKGKVMVSSRVQQVQSLEGGVLHALNVKEGQTVRKGDVLAVLQNAQFDADLGQSQQSLRGAQAAIARLQAESTGREPVFSAELERAAPGIVAEQRARWRLRQAEQQAAIATLRDQQAQRQHELSEAQARVQTAQATLVPALESLAMEERLATQGAGVRADLLTVQQRVASLRGELEAARISVQRLQAANREAQARINEARAKFLAEVSRERTQNELESADRIEQLKGRVDRVRRQELRAPMDGVVNRVLMTTLSGVVKAGETLIELVPVSDKLQIAVRVQPADIAFIAPGQSAKVRISAYDSSIFGALDAKVVRVGADSIVDERRDPSLREGTFFEVLLEADRNYVGKLEEKLKISTGMAADASVLTGKRSVMNYLLKPLVKTFDRALHER